MRKYLLLVVGLVLAIIGYYFGINESMKWLTLAFYLIAAICFVIQAIIMIKNQTGKKVRE
ncbi:hypothetical protein [Bacillus sp. AK031]